MFQRKQNRPDTNVLQRMEADWDARARENARHYVATSREIWTDEAFFRSGAISVHDQVLRDFATICNGRFPADMCVLEIGCGAGRVTKSFARLFGKVHAIDISSEMIRQAQSALRDCANVSLYKTDGADLSLFKNEMFDFAYSEVVFQHIPSKAVVEQYIREASRVLKPGSVFRFQLQGHQIPESEADTWVGAGFGAEELFTILRDAGFDVRKAEGASTQLFWLTALKLPDTFNAYRPKE